MKKTLSLTLGLVLSSWASANDDTDLIQQLFDAGQSVEAYELGQELQPALAGDPRFDYYFGASAVDSGDASQGVFALERVLLLEPGNQAARLELARGYFQLEEYQRSRNEFEIVMQSEPPEEVQEKVQNFLDAIRRKESRYRTTAASFFRIGAGHDSNANAATDDETTTFFGNNGTVGAKIALNPNSRAAASRFTDIALGANFSFPLTPSWAIRTGTSLEASLYSDDIASDVNTTVFNFYGGVEQTLKNHKLSYTASHQALVLKDDFYRNLSSFSLGWRYNLNEKSLVSAFARLGQIEYQRANDNLRDTDSTVIGARYLYKLGATFSPIIIAGVQLGSDHAQREDPTIKAFVERDFSGFNLGTQLSFSQKSALSANMNWLKSEYIGTDPRFNQSREDELFSIRLEHNYLITKRWKINSYINHSDNQSIAGLYEYTRDRFGINFIYETN
jgi:hypothetical protein